MKRITFIAMAAALWGCMTGPEQLASQRPVTPAVHHNIAEAARTALKDPNTYVCVKANSKNGFGGYEGRKGYVVTLSNSRPTNVFQNDAWCATPEIKYEHFTELENLKNL